MSEANTHFLWWCAGLNTFDRNLLRQTPLDQSKYTSIGAAVLLTAILAAFTGGYAFWTVTNGLAVSFVFGLFWSLIIFNIDRFAVSLPASGKPFRNLINALPRLALAGLIGLVIAVPLELKIFEKEIEAQLRTDMIKHFNQVDGLLTPQQSKRNALQSQNEKEKAALAAAYARVLELEAQAVREADGSGGTKERGVGPIYALKRAQAEKARIDFARMSRNTRTSLAKREQEIRAITQEIEAARQSAMAAKNAATGLLARIEALGKKAETSTAVRSAVWYVTALLIALEITPVLFKVLSGQGTYDLRRRQLSEAARKRMGYELIYWEGDMKTWVKLREIMNRFEIANALDRFRNRMNGGANSIHRSAHIGTNANREGAQPPYGRPGEPKNGPVRRLPPSDYRH